LDSEARVRNQIDSEYRSPNHTNKRCAKGVPFGETDRTRILEVAL